jgi:hypothetical protein
MITPASLVTSVAASLAALAPLVVVGAFGCSGAPNDARIGIDAPDRASFDHVGMYLEHRCGSLDCHGNRQRNLQLWGGEGMRLAPEAGITGDPLDTTPEELDASYRSIVGLEPAVMSAVVHGHGAQPNLLTFVRKARGTESHKGGALIKPGDDQDKCIASWLKGAVDDDACTNALKTP